MKEKTTKLLSILEPKRQTNGEYLMRNEFYYKWLAICQTSDQNKAIVSFFSLFNWLLFATKNKIQIKSILVSNKTNKIEALISKSFSMPTENQILFDCTHRTDGQTAHHCRHQHESHLIGHLWRAEDDVQRWWVNVDRLDRSTELVPQHQQQQHHDIGLSGNYGNCTRLRLMSDWV